MSGSNPLEATRARLSAVTSEIEQLRGPPPIPSLKPEPVPAARIHRLMDLLAEAAVHHVHLQQFDEARRCVADAIVYMQDVVDGAAIARASLLTGEALVDLDSPKHAKARLEVATAYYEKVGDAKLAARARISLARSLILLDDPTGLEMLHAMQQDLIARGEAVALARVEALLQEARTGGDAAHTVRAGYGRAVSIPPGRG